MLDRCCLSAWKQKDVFVFASTAERVCYSANWCVAEKDKENVLTKRSQGTDTKQLNISPKNIYLRNKMCNANAYAAAAFHWQ